MGGKSVGIVGFGQLGGFLAKHLRNDFDIFVSGTFRF